MRLLIWGLVVKDVVFLGDSLDRIRDFPAAAREDMGRQINRVQHGREPSDWKPFPEIGTGVREIRVREASGIYRAFYVASIGMVVYVIHAFQKTQKTDRRDVELAKARFKQIKE
jgi:phage-related protein